MSSSPPPSPPSTCKVCELSTCPEGTTQIYCNSDDECSALSAVSAEQQATYDTLSMTANATNAYCMDALRQFWCSQQRVYQVVRSTGTSTAVTQTTSVSSCSTYRRPFLSTLNNCLRFCPAIEAACAGSNVASRYCETTCQENIGTEFCPLIRFGGVDDSWPDEVQDVNTVFRIETDAAAPILANGRPRYRSVPSRRSRFSSRVDYYLYSTERSGFTEWLIDRNDNEVDGATAFVASNDFAPSDIHSGWAFWHAENKEWQGVALAVVCDLTADTSSASRRHSGWCSRELATALPAAIVAWGAWRHLGRGRRRAARAFGRSSP